MFLKMSTAFVLTSCSLLAGLVTAGEHHRSPLLGHQSATTAKFPLTLSVQNSIHTIDNPTVLFTKNSPFSGLNVTWSNVDNPTVNDLITLSCNLYDNDLNDFFDVASVTGESSGSITLPPLPDLRCQYIVRYVRTFTLDTSSKKRKGEVLAEHKIDHSFGLLPTQAHLSFTESGRLDEMLVIWVSGKNSTEPKKPGEITSSSSSSPLRVEWGLTKDNLTSSSPSTSMTYTNTDMCNAPANETGLQKFIPPGFIHRAVMSSLPLKTIIFYRVGHDDHGWSEIRSFMSRRPANTANTTTMSSSIKFLMYADQALPVMFFGPAWRLVQQVVDDIEAGYNAFLLHPGDLGYAEGTGFVWDFWSSLVEPITSRIPYMVTTGNHEYDHSGIHPDPSNAPPGGWHPHGDSPVPWGNLGDDSQGECGKNNFRIQNSDILCMYTVFV